jgi:iron complex outermembrane recepter protein
MPSPRIARRSLLFCLLTCLALLTVARADPAADDPLSRTARFDIKAQALATALIEFSQQAEVQIAAPANMVEHLVTKGVRGRMSVATALQELLSGTRLGFHAAGVNTIGINRARGAAAPSAAAIYAASAQNAPGASGADSPLPPPTLTAQPENPAVLEEVVVTARRSVERSLNVPVAITAFSQEDLRENDIETATDLQNYVPSLTVMGLNSGSQEFFTIRGLGATGSLTGGGVGGGQGVVAYLAEAPATASGPGLFFDLQSLQVLKGPQGTLFGRNTTGGAVLLEPVRPSDELNASLELTSGDFGRRKITAAGNIPIVPDKLMVRLAGEGEYLEGYTKDAVTGRDYNNRQDASGRIGILARPFSGFENYLLGEFVHFTDHGPGNVLVALNPDNALYPLLSPYLAAQQARGIGLVSYGFMPSEDSKTLMVIDNASWQLTPDLALKNIFSYTHAQENGSTDADATPLPVADLLGANPGGWSSDLKTLTEELHLQGNAWRDFLTWQAGGYYEHVYTGGPQTYNIEFAPILLNQALKDDRSLSRAAYSQATLDLGAFSPALRGLDLTAGYRHTWDSIYQGGFSSGSIPQLGLVVCGTGPGPYPNCFQAGSAKSDGPSWTVGLDYHLGAQTMVYLRSSEGYKSGGFNPSVPENNPYFAYRPEKARDVELGIKSDAQLGGMPMRTDFDVFRTDYGDAQRNVYALINVNGIPAQLQLTDNAASAVIQGAELQETLIPASFVQLSLTYSYLDAFYQHYITPIGQDFTTHRFEFVPRNKVSFDQLYRLPVGGLPGKLTFRTTISYQSSLETADDVEPFGVMGGYTLVNLRLDWNDFLRTGSGSWDLALFVNNVTDRIYRITSNPTYYSSGLVTAIYGQPRMWGASIRCRF